MTDQPDITIDNMEQRLLEVIPEVRPVYDAEVGDLFEGEPAGAHNAYEMALVPFIVSLVPSGKDEVLLKRIFDFLEQLAASPQSWVQGVVHLSVLEPLYHDHRDDLEEVRQNMGTATLEMLHTIEKNAQPEGYSDTVMDHFEHPRNNGVLDDANALGYMTNPVCGDTLLLMLRIDGGRIAEVRWKSDGCAASIAASSLLSELVRGRTVDEARAITREAVVDALGGLPASKLHASVLAADALHRALDDYAGKGRNSAE
jgi:nitrogen fixation NifU-like protein